MAEDLPVLELREMPGGAGGLGNCHIFLALDESYTIAQPSAHLPGELEVPSLNPGCVA